MVSGKLPAYAPARQGSAGGKASAGKKKRAFRVKRDARFLFQDILYRHARDLSVLQNRATALGLSESQLIGRYPPGDEFRDFIWGGMVG